MGINAGEVKEAEAEFDFLMLKAVSVVLTKENAKHGQIITQNENNIDAVSLKAGRKFALFRQFRSLHRSSFVERTICESRTMLLLLMEVRSSQDMVGSGRHFW